MAFFLTNNPILENLSQIPSNLIWRFSKHKSNKKHIFVLGAPRSGTTLIKLILGSHSSLISPGHETGIFLYRNLWKFDLNCGNISPDTILKMKKDSPNIIEFFDDFVAKHLDLLGGKYFVEKTPSHVLHLKFLRESFPDSYFINIYRDGRDAYCSSLQHPNIPQKKNIKTFANYWKTCIKARLKEGNQSNIFDIKYEDLVISPEKNIRALMEFLQEDFQVEQLNFYTNKNHKLVNKPKKEFEKLTQPINNSSVSRYRQELTSSQIDEFNKIAGKELKLLGYMI